MSTSSSSSTTSGARKRKSAPAAHILDLTNEESSSSAGDDADSKPIVKRPLAHMDDLRAVQQVLQEPLKAQCDSMLIIVFPDQDDQLEYGFIPVHKWVATKREHGQEDWDRVYRLLTEVTVNADEEAGQPENVMALMRLCYSNELAVVDKEMAIDYGVPSYLLEGTACSPKEELLKICVADRRFVLPFFDEDLMGTGAVTPFDWVVHLHF